MWPKAMVFIAGFILTALGITLVLQQWDSVVLVFKAFIGPLLAVLVWLFYLPPLLRVMIKAVIFDLDGTLVNAYPAVSRSVNYTLHALGLAPRSNAEIKRSVGGGDRKLMAHFVGQKLAPRALAIYRPHHTKVLKVKGAVKLLPGAGVILKFLKGKGYKLAIASNRPTKFTRIILKVLGIGPFFDLVLCADRAPKPKPHPDMLWEIARHLNIENPEVLYVGDMTIDVDCAHRAGVRMVAVSTGSSSKKELKDLKPWLIIDKIDQLKKIMPA